MTQKELVAQISKQTGLTLKQANEALNAFYDLTATALQNGDSVRLTGFGSFETRKRSARTLTIPMTGEQMDVPAAIVPVFKAGKNLKEKVNKNI